MIKWIASILFSVLILSASSQQKRILSLEGSWKFTIGDDPEYAFPYYNDTNWEEIWVPSPWENEGFANYNGYAWYRVTFDGRDLNGFRNLLLNLGYIDDVHEAYLNGELLGFNGAFPPSYYTSYDALNQYAIPDDLIHHDGKNVLAIKVYDLIRDGGIVKGNKIGIWVEPKIPEDFYSLEGIWKFTTKRTVDWEVTDLDDSKWGNIVVPSFWKSKYIKQSRGYGWYRKEFVLPERLKGKDIYLILGVIDDFDYTYLNGEIIGRTKDFLPFGQSNSWQELRVYKIPENKLNQEGKNIIAVQVEDLGIDAGIYKGPVGIAEYILPSKLYQKN